jgi:hypothetical protein
MIDDDISNFGPANIQAMDRLEVVKVRDDRLSNEKKVIQTPLFFAFAGLPSHCQVHPSRQPAPQPLWLLCFS